jgi:hypothetical protein
MCDLKGIMVTEETRSLLLLLANEPERSVAQVSAATGMSEDAIDQATNDATLFEVDMLADVPVSVKLTDHGRRVGRALATST